jgi:hypothetical protein
MPLRRPKWLVVDWSRTSLGTPRRFGDPSRPPSLRGVLEMVVPVWAFWMTWYAFMYGLVEAVQIAGPVLGGCLAFFWLLLFGRWQLYVARYETPGRHPVAVLALRAVGLFLLTPFAFVLGSFGVLSLVGWEGRDVAGGLFWVVCAALIAGLGYLAVRRPFLGGLLLLYPPLTLSGGCLLTAAILERRDPDSLRYVPPGRRARASALRTVGLVLLAPFVVFLGFGGVIFLVGWGERDVAAGLFGVVCTALIAGLGYLAVRRPFLGSSLLLVPPLTLSGTCLLAAAILERRDRDLDRAGGEPVRHAAPGAYEVPAGPQGRRAPLSPANRAARPARDLRHPSRAHRRSRPVSPRGGDRRG